MIRLTRCSIPTGYGLGQNPSLFEIGSITKAFTGALLADMHVRREVDLEDPLSRHLTPTGCFAGFSPERDRAAVVLSNTARSVDRLGMRLLDGG